MDTPRYARLGEEPLSEESADFPVIGGLGQFAAPLISGPVYVEVPRHAALTDITEAPSPVEAPALVPSPRQPDPRHAVPGQPESAPPGTTMVLPYVGSRASKRTRALRSWMLTAPVDFLALLVPLAFSIDYWRGTLVAATLAIIFFAAGGHYRPRRHVSFLDELPSLCGRLLAAIAIVAIIAAVRHDSVEYSTNFIVAMVGSAFLVLICRAVLRKVTEVARMRRWVEHNAVVLGTGPIGVELARLVRRYPQYGLRFVGHVDSAERAGDTSVPLIGTLDKLAETIAMTEADVVLIADPECAEGELMDIMRQPGCVECDLWVVPRLWGSRGLGSGSDHIGAIPVVRISNTTLSGPRYAIKRLSDIVAASIALLLLSPVLLVCAFLTFCDGGRGIFFKQERIGRDGKPFNVLKFRSMRPRDETESRTNWSIADDKRVTFIGRFMRRTSLDELPQLWNILRGDMTFVGPRPERPYFVEKFTAEYPEYARRHRMPVGLTGLAQVSGLRGDTPISDRARFDNFYIENWSLWLDVKVVVRTITEVFRGGGR